jgi:hypothetical protein
MISRRTWARIRFVIRLPRFIRMIDRIYGNQENAPIRLDLRYFLLGLLEQIALEWVHDRNYWRLRTNYWRRSYTFVVGVLLSLKWFSSITEAERESFSLGIAVGGVLYRLWYGVLHPLPRSIE